MGLANRIARHRALSRNRPKRGHTFLRVEGPTNLAELSYAGLLALAITQEAVIRWNDEKRTIWLHKPIYL